MDLLNNVDGPMDEVLLFEAVSRRAVLTIELGPGTHRGAHEDCNIRMCKHSAWLCWLPARGLLLKSSLSSVASRAARDAGEF